MPLRDHTKKPYSNPVNMQGIHGRWPNVVLEYLNRKLPAKYRMLPNIHLGRSYEIDIGSVDREPSGDEAVDRNDSGGILTMAIPHPTLSHVIDDEKYAEYEVKVYEIEGERLVAAIEFASPANKDRPTSRAEFAAKCAHLWKNRICVSIIDIAIERKFNLYADTLDLIGHEDPAFSGGSIPQYAATLRAIGNHHDGKYHLESWAYPLATGQSLPKIPIILSETEAIMLDLEETYEETIRSLRMDPLTGAK